jgi:uncharacterized membrane protein YczE
MENNMRKSTLPQWGIRVLFYCIALFFMALGVAFSANSDLGISPVNSLPYVISDILKMQPGTCVTAVFCFYILVQIILLRREFNPVNLFQIVFSTIFGYFVNFTKWMVGDFLLPGGYAGRLILQCIGIIFVAFGVLLYLDVDIVPMPMEGMTMAIAEKVGKPFPTVKTFVDCTVVALGVLLTVVCLHLIPFVDAGVRIREGTILAALVTGKVIQIMRKPISPLVKKICFGTEKE